jgi:hypothetical protein
MMDRAVADERYVKPNALAIPTFIDGQKRFCGLQKPGLLARRHRMGSLGKTIPGFHLNENEQVIICNNEVDFPKPGALALGQHIKTAKLPISQHG